MQSAQATHKNRHYRDLLSRMDITLWVRRDAVCQQIVHFDTTPQSDTTADTASDKQHDDGSVADIAPNSPTSTTIATATNSSITPSTDVSPASVIDSSQTETDELPSAHDSDSDDNQKNQNSHHVKHTADAVIDTEATISQSALDKGVGTDGSNDRQQEIAHEQTLPTSEKQQTEQLRETVAQPAFMLYALCYKRSVILCDGSSLHNEQVSALWQSIQHALRSSLHQLSFPLTDTINDTDAMSHECAQASVAGWLYQLGQLTDKEETQCVLLGDTTAPVPETITILSGLSSMLTNPQNKKTLWELIKSNKILMRHA